MISVIIPVYNAEKYLEDCVLSACSQTEVSEVILVEDGSLDNSLKVCKNLIKKKPDKVKLFCHKDQGNKGAGASRNLGVEKSTNDIVAFLDADDYYLKNRFEVDLKILERSEVDGVYSAIGTKFYDAAAEKRYLDKGLNENSLTTMSEEIAPEKLFYKMGPIGKKGYFHLNGLTIKKRAFIVSGGFNTKLELSQDTHFCIKLSLKCNLVSGQLKHPVAMRGVHACNRISDEVKMKSFRRALFLDLMKWTAKNNISYSKRNLICKHYLTWFNYSLSRKDVRFFDISLRVLYFKTFYRFILNLGRAFLVKE